MKKIRKKLLKIFLIGIIFFALPILVINKMFYYSTFEPSSSLKLNGVITEDIYSSFQNTTRIDRNNQVLYFQKVQKDLILKRVNEVLNEKEISFEYSEIIPAQTKSDILRSIFIGIGIFFIVNLLGTIYFVYRKSTIEGSYLSITKIIFGSIALVIISVILQTTFISIFSRFYQVKEIDTLTILISGIWAVILANHSWLSVRNTIRHSISNIKDKILRNIKTSSTYLVLTISSLLIPLSFSMGASFVLPAIFLSSAFLFPIIVIEEVSNFKLPKKKTIKNSTPNTKIKEIERSFKKAKPWKKFNKKKKHK